MRKLEQNKMMPFCSVFLWDENEWYGVYYVFLTNDKSESI
jgi:hypothetical protein